MSHPDEAATDALRTKPIVFISHRFADSAVAKQVADTLRYVSGRRLDIHLASDPKYAGPRVGESIPEELINVLGRTSVVVLIYSSTDDDWAWCMWECGVATDPLDKVPTRIVTISLSGTPPKVFGEKLSITAADPQEVLRLVNELCTDPNFFPGRNHSLTDREPLDEFVRDQATVLHERLAAYTTPTTDKARWGGFTVSLDEGVSKRLRELADSSSSSIVREVLEAGRVSNPVEDGLKHFGFAGIESDLTLAAVRDRWELKRGTERVDNTPWDVIIVDEFWRIATNQEPKMIWHPFKSVKEGTNLWLYPVVSRYRRRNDGPFEFDILIIQTLEP